MSYPGQKEFNALGWVVCVGLPIGIAILLVLLSL